MKKDFKIEFPEGVNITDIQSTLSENGTVATITMCIKEKEEYVPKNGDFVRIVGNFQECIAIYNVESDIWQRQTKLFFHALLGKTDKKLIINDWAYSREVFPATTDEILELEAALAKKGKRWNAEKKCIEDLPKWRADMSEAYFYISSECSIAETIECHCYTDGKRYNVGNYFKTKEAAEKVAEKIREIFKNSKAE